MKIVTHQPPPAKEPPPTYDIVGLDAEDMQILLEICQRSTYIGRMMYTSFGSEHHGQHISQMLNTLYHELMKVGRIK